MVYSSDFNNGNKVSGMSLRDAFYRGSDRRRRRAQVDLEATVALGSHWQEQFDQYHLPELSTAVAPRSRKQIPEPI